MPVPWRGVTRAHRRPQPASGLSQNPRRESPCARRYRIQKPVTSPPRGGAHLNANDDPNAAPPRHDRTNTMVPKLPPVPAICHSAVRAPARRGAPDRAGRALVEPTPHILRECRAAEEWVEAARANRIGLFRGDRRAQAGSPSHTDLQHLRRRIYAPAGLDNVRIHDPTTQLCVRTGMFTSLRPRPRGSIRSDAGSPN